MRSLLPGAVALCLAAVLGLACAIRNRNVKAVRVPLDAGRRLGPPDTDAAYRGAAYRQRMPGARHAPGSWQQVATAFEHDTTGVLDLLNEPHPNDLQATGALGDTGAGSRDGTPAAYGAGLRDRPPTTP
ncbi:hypothetical protein ACFY4C_04645 [Actinomadura viridis]|uniref:hypothetical protein n=1 Tax=Actinomadura viridis TaxID=58110 RepID=UPI0036A53558